MGAYRLLSLGSVLLLLAGCGVTTRGDFEKQFSVSQSVSSPLVIAKKQIPLPDGKWVVASQGTTTTSLSTPIAGLILVNMDRSAEAVAVEVYTNIEPSISTTGWNPLKACGRKDMISPSPKSSFSAGDEECWFINHNKFIRSSKTTPMARLRNAAFDFAHLKNLELPNTGIYTGYRIADGSDYVTIRYYFNPEAKGLSPDNAGSWSGSNWHRDRLVRDSKRVAYIDNQKKWSALWLKKVKTGFNGKLQKPAGLYPLKKSVEPTRKKSAKPTNWTTEARLKKLKDLRDKNLITPEEYQNRRRAILEQL